MERLFSEKAHEYADTLTVSPWYLVIGVVPLVWLWRRWHSQLPIPTYGGILSFSRSLSLIRLTLMGRRQYLTWYEEDPMVLVPRPDTWTALVHSKYIEEMSRAPEDQLSFVDAASNIFQTRYNFGPWVSEDPFHQEVIKKQLTRNLLILFPRIFEEVQDCISEQVQSEKDGSASVTVFPFIQQIIARASNRVFVGLPLCRDERWLSIVRNTAMDTIKVATFVNMFPEILRPIVGRLVSPTERRITKAMKIIGPIVEEKLAQSVADPTAPPRDDYISWLISYAPERERSVRHIINRLLLTNFSAIYTSTTNVTHAIYWLLSRPHYIEPLRVEIQEVTDRLGWCRDAIGSMPKLDSFMKECMRMTPISPQTMNRIALKPFTFSNGVHIPTGTSISSHAYGTHQDRRFYPNADSFDGFRFVKHDHESEEDLDSVDLGDERKPTARSTMYSTSSTYLSFGHGKHACPGRFFASMEVKLIMAYLIYNYDIEWPKEVYKPDGNNPDGKKEGYRPVDIWFGTSIIPSRTAKMVLRKRVAE